MYMFPKTYKSLKNKETSLTYLFASRTSVGLLKNKENPRSHCSKEALPKERRKAHKILTQVSAAAKKAHFRLHESSII